ncbi:hypothetical protein GOP47_0016269 [Adiantum capillus-veneris]|uniref:Uncharacterized protein n=1 Tax=Adiantum capillus-veneris TaxID=13818 RepID=A0A9D4UHC5_ADICA|nr:hypothetical protein GOP47_0016269 [Adiantum capillus-veneris]
MSLFCMQVALLVALLVLFMSHHIDIVASHIDAAEAAAEVGRKRVELEVAPTELQHHPNHNISSKYKEENPSSHHEEGSPKKAGSKELEGAPKPKVGDEHKEPNHHHEHAGPPLKAGEPGLGPKKPPPPPLTNFKLACSCDLVAA